MITPMTASTGIAGTPKWSMRTWYTPLMRRMGLSRHITLVYTMNTMGTMTGPNGTITPTITWCKLFQPTITMWL
jgi:hypothetical protein